MGCYRDLHGQWRWEYQAPDGEMRDSQRSYPSFDECIEDARKAGADEQQQHAGAKRTVLSVHPEKQVQESISHTLNDWTVLCASTGYDAIRALNRQTFDAYVLDYWLPDWSGIELCREIRKSDPQVPICFYSSARNEQYRSRALRAGATFYLRNPNDIGSLRHALSSLIEAADIQSLQARLAEQLAVQEELERRAAAAAAHIERARMMTAEATERMARAQAAKAFLECGGTRANFERWWPNVFASAMSTRRTKTS